MAATDSVQLIERSTASTDTERYLWKLSMPYESLALVPPVRAADVRSIRRQESTKSIPVWQGKLRTERARSS